MVIIRPGYMRMVVTSKKPFPESLRVTFQISNHNLISFFGIGQIYPLQQTLHVKSYRIAALIVSWIQYLCYVLEWK
ncbi:hypothetical protein [Paenibacillus oryzisoli]|uniref:Uncharacterized protein n=1 Tax=Paenibacillus oryzisoli TaxID=1850517 RepID=A0A198AU96_9BACL|nr:hypothetical protein [Paenibacillus oryzisoli]OAS25124.1 hypothetical protein A8708_31700 [Paenibacillus oryzisoli]